MKSIAFDTSNQPLSVALFDNGQLVGQKEANIAKNHSVQLLPFMDDLLTTNGWVPSDLDQVIVSQGPGSYTGLRIAVTTAKTLAFTLGLSLIGVSSLAVLAANVDVPNAVIVPIMDARNDNMYAGQYKWQAGVLKSVVDDRHTNLTNLIAALEQITEQIIFVGEWDRFEESLKAHFSEAEFAEDTANLPHAATMLALSKEAPVLTNMAAIHQFVPNYLRLSQPEADWAVKHPDAGDADYVELV